MKTSVIRAFTRPKALCSAPLARRGWIEAATETSNGWKVVTSEKHRVTLVKGDDLVFFAHDDADFDNPRPLSEQDKASARAIAIEWTKLNASLTTKNAFGR